MARISHPNWLVFRCHRGPVGFFLVRQQYHTLPVAIGCRCFFLKRTQEQECESFCNVSVFSSFYCIWLFQNSDRLWFLINHLASWSWHNAMKTELGQPKRILSEETCSLKRTILKGKWSSNHHFSKFLNFLNNTSDHHIHPITQNQCLCSNPISCVLFCVGSVCHFLIFLFPNFNNSFTFNPPFL